MHDDGLPAQVARADEHTQELDEPGRCDAFLAWGNYELNRALTLALQDPATTPKLKVRA